MSHLAVLFFSAYHRPNYGHIKFSKLLSYEKLSQIILSYFSIFQRLTRHSSKAKEVSRSPEN